MRRILSRRRLSIEPLEVRQLMAINVTEVESNNSFAAAQYLPAGSSYLVSGQRSTDDVDYFKFWANAGQTIDLVAWEANNSQLTTSFDPMIALYDPSGVQLASDDDSGRAPNTSYWAAKLSRVAPTNGYYAAAVTDYPDHDFDGLGSGGGPGADTGAYKLSINGPGATSVVGRRLFYNYSSYDGNNGAANASDDGAIATDKVALTGSTAAAVANISNFSKGINGIMVDIAGLVGQTLSQSDFTIRVGNNNGWTTGPAPSSITNRAGAGVSGSDRVTLIWPDNSLTNTWVQVTVNATPNTRLPAPDVFHFGHAMGETFDCPDNLVVTDADETRIRQNPSGLTSPANITNIYDLNRDKRVSATDQVIARNNKNTYATALKFLNGTNVEPYSATISLSAPQGAYTAVGQPIWIHGTVTGEQGSPRNRKWEQTSTNGGTGNFSESMSSLDQDFWATAPGDVKITLKADGCGCQGSGELTVHAIKTGTVGPEEIDFTATTPWIDLGQQTTYTIGNTASIYGPLRKVELLLPLDDDNPYLEWRDYFTEVNPFTGDVTLTIARDGAYIVKKTMGATPAAETKEQVEIFKGSKPPVEGAFRYEALWYKASAPKEASLVLIGDPKPEHWLAVYPDGVLITSVDDAITKVNDYWNTKANGVPFTLIIGDHGKPGQQSFGDGNVVVTGKFLDWQDSSKTLRDKFTAALKGKVSAIHFNGCNVAADDFLEGSQGAGTKFLKQIANGINAPASGWTRQSLLQSNGDYGLQVGCEFKLVVPDAWEGN